MLARRKKGGEEEEEREKNKINKSRHLEGPKGAGV